ncbi:hypothetical protein [Salinispora arenicola]|uniref:Flavin reductase n=1 Tax=Salinispora arenicola (strain CNS-205) TaxID=391037 RepID=A8M6G2_SALAI|nr:hypothetical protein [Salinispora arenicola]
MTGQQRRLAANRLAPAVVEHVSMRPLWLCRRCGQPWPCGAARLALLAEYRDAPVSLFLYLAGCLHDAIDDLHRLNPRVTGSAADMFDRFLGWPAWHTHAYRVGTTTAVSIEEGFS